VLSTALHWRTARCTYARLLAIAQNTVTPAPSSSQEPTAAHRPSCPSSRVPEVSLLFCAVCTVKIFFFFYLQGSAAAVLSHGTCTCQKEYVSISLSLLFQWVPFDGKARGGGEW